MNKKVNLYESLYDDIRMQLFVGNLKYGDQLPSVNQLCSQYNLGRNTVRTALLKLQKDGYIQMTQGVKPIVLYEPENYHQNHINIIGQRKDAILELTEIMNILIPQWMAQSILFCQKERADFCLEILRKIDPWNQPFKEIFYKVLETMKLIFSSLNNPLIVDLFSSTVHFAVIPYVNKKNILNPHLKIAWSMKERLEEFLELYYRKSDRTMEKIMEKDCLQIRGLLEKYFTDLVSESQNEKIYFKWYVGKEKRYVYSKIAIDLIWKISVGEYKKGEFLPPVSQMKEEYGISSVVMQHSFTLLERMGMIKQIQSGESIKYLVDMQPHLCIEESFIRNCLLHYLCAIHMLAISIKKMVLFNADHFCMKTIDCLKELQNAGKEKWEKASILQLILDALFSSAPSHTFQTIFRSLNEILLWGYCIHIFYHPHHIQDQKERLIEIIDSLENREAMETAELLQNYFYHLFLHTKEILLEIGVFEVKEMMAPHFL